MCRFVAVFLLCIGLLASRVAWADGIENNMELARNSAAKNLVLVSLATVAMVGWGGALYWEVKGLSAKSDRGDLGDPHDFCGGNFSAAACQKWNDSVANQDDASGRQIPFVVVGGGATLALFFTAMLWPNESRKVAFVPVASPTSKGFVLHGEF